MNAHHLSAQQLLTGRKSLAGKYDKQSEMIFQAFEFGEPNCNALSNHISV
jgi:hypothetical protein